MQASHWSGRAIALLAAIAAFTAIPSADLPGGVSLRVTQEFAPPGGSAQLKLELTEPKPISTGRGRIDYSGFSDIDGIALISPADDTYGVAVVEGGEIGLSLRSPSATFGTADYPLVTINGRIPAGTPLGTVFPVNLDQRSIEFRDAAGVVYPSEVKNGSVTIARGISIREVRPGSADLPAGAVVTILGTGFVAGTEIDFGDADIASTTFVSSTRIDVVLQAPARMHGMRVRAENPDDSERVEFYSYQRTTRTLISADPVLRAAVPLFPQRSVASAIVDLEGSRAGLAVQNIRPRAAKVTAELFGSSGDLLAARILKLPANRYFVNEISEFFGVPYGAGSFVRVRANRPIQAMGIAVGTSGTATPLQPR